MGANMTIVLTLALLVVIVVSVIAILTLTKNYGRKVKSFLAEIDDAKAKVGEYKNKYKSIENEYDELARVKTLVVDEQNKLALLQRDYERNKLVHDKLSKEILIIEDSLDAYAVGLYKPFFDFSDIESYKEAISNVRESMKKFVKEKKAIFCLHEWTVGGSRAEGLKMVNRQMKLMLQAFNSQCDTANLKARWDNIDKMEARIAKAFDDINKIGEPTKIRISNDYRDLRLAELHLVYEHQLKIYEEKEEQRRLREEEREAEKVKREIESKVSKVEKEEKEYKESILKVKERLISAHDDEKEALKNKIFELEEKLTIAQAEKERAISQAQLTRSGHVYVLSNVGSFGKDVFKIGMTRRLDPLERVKELGDASVPFGFDVHALIYTKDAPNLESLLHKAFEKYRVNLANNRKEYFKIELNEIENAVKGAGIDFEFVRTIEARELRQTLSLRKALLGVG